MAKFALLFCLLIFSAYVSDISTALSINYYYQLICLIIILVEMRVVAKGRAVRYGRELIVIIITVTSIYLKRYVSMRNDFFVKSKTLRFDI